MISTDEISQGVFDSVGELVHIKGAEYKLHSELNSVDHLDRRQPGTWNPFLSSLDGEI